MSRKVGDRVKDPSGRIREWVSPGWWQPVLTDEEKRILASGKIPPAWEPTPEEIAKAEEWAREDLDGKVTARCA